MVAIFCNPIKRSFVAFLLVIGSLIMPMASWAQAQEIAEPNIEARAAIVVEYPSGKILYAKAMHDRLAPASTTKILTSILAIEHGNLEDVATVSADDLVGESTMGLESGERQTLHNLLYGMMLPSGNDAAMTTARYLGAQAAAPGGKGPVTRFIDIMNARVAQLGLVDSHFVNPHGLDADGHYSSAYDLASLTWYALQSPVFNEIIREPFYEAGGHPLKNTNEMLSRYPGADGVKTGWTDAGGLCLVTSATRDGHRLISVVLNAPYWYNDSGTILDYAFAKLAAPKAADNAEVLSVTARGTAQWLLANATSTPPIPPPQVMAQGGGAADGGVGGGAPSRTDEDKFVTHASLGARESNGGLSLGSLAFPMSVLVAVVGLVAWWIVKPRFLFNASGPADRPSSSDYKARLRGLLGPRARTLGEDPAIGRRQPNLMITREDACQAHVERAVMLADQERQGSSMAEFLLALRSGCVLKVVDVDKAYDLSPTGFLALYRAQAAMGMMSDALETLQYAVAAVPGDRILALTLRQFRVRE